jgi:spermidine synthase
VVTTPVVDAPLVDVPEPEVAREVPPEPVAASGEVVIGEGRSEYNHVLVTEEGTLRRMHFVTPDGRRLLQSTYDTSRPVALDHEVFQTMISALFVQPKVRRMMMVGVGGAQVTNYLFGRLEGLAIDAVDICPEVIRLAQAHFGVPDSPDYRFHVADARVFIEEGAEGKYDLIVVDAFRGHSIPIHLRSRQFFESVSNRLAPGGVMVVNMHRLADRYASDRTTIAAVFPNCYRFSSPDDVQTSIVCGNEKRALSAAQLLDNARALQPDFDFDLIGLATRVTQEQDWVSTVVLEDAFDSGRLEQQAREENLSCAPDCDGDR